MSLRTTLISLGLATALALTGCATGGTPSASPACTPSASSTASPDPTPSCTPTATPTPTPTPVEYAPLTGEEVVPGSLDHPVLMAKIDNLDEARPQAGINDTDIVFEELVEGGLTRYVAVWHSTVPKYIGPVRSIRPMDPDIASPFRGIIAFSGGQYRFVVMMQNTKVKNIIDGLSPSQKYMFRDSKRVAPHNVIVRASKLVDAYSKLSPPTPAFAFAHGTDVPTAVALGDPRGKLTTSFSEFNTPSWKWDAATGLYKRYQAGGDKDVDEHHKQLTAVNVIVQMTDESSEYGYVPRAHVVGKGTAYISTGGSTVKAIWRKANRNAMTHYTLKDGTEVTLAPGNTWIELIPTTTGRFSASRR
ncbi:MAG: hypothetical protein RLZZ319_817 [Actinomycetota bacterium]